MKDRITTLEQNYNHLDSRLTDMGRKLDRVVEAVTRHSAAPQFDPGRILTFVMQATILFGLVTSGIVYVASNVAEARLAVLETKVQIYIHKGAKE
jgi:hypothetical protein